MRACFVFPILVALAWPIAANAQSQRLLQIGFLGSPPPQSVTARAQKGDTPLPLTQNGSVFSRSLPAGTTYRIELRYPEDGSHHLAPGWDTLRILYYVPPGPDAFFVQVTRDYPVGCNRPELNRLTSSTDAQAWDNALRGRLMLLQRDKNSCNNIGEDDKFGLAVKEAYLKLCRRVTRDNPNFRGLQ